MVTQPMSNGDKPNNEPEEEEEVELTEEEKKIDAEYQQRCHDHQTKRAGLVGCALEETADQPLFATTTTKTVTETTEYHAPVALLVMGAILKAGPSPVDPLVDKRGPGFKEGVVAGITEKLLEMATMYASMQAAKQRMTSPPATSEPPAPPPPPSPESV